MEKTLKGRSETQSIVLYFNHSTTVDTVTQYITTNIDVKTIILHSVSINNLDNTHTDALQLITTDLLPPQAKQILYPILPSNNASAFSDYPTQINPHLIFQFDHSQRFNGSYTFKLVSNNGLTNGAIGNPTTVSMLVVLQFEFLDY